MTARAAALAGRRAPTRVRPAGSPPGWVETARLGLVALTLNAGWLVACAPVVTAPAATTALFAAVRRWRVEAEEPSGRRFLLDLRARFWRDLVVGGVVAAVAAVVALDLAVIGRMGGERRVLLVLWLACGVGLGLASVFAPAVAAGHLGGPQPSPRHTLGGAARTAVARPLAAAAATGLVVGAAALVSVAPVALLGAGVAVAAVVDRLSTGRAS